MSNASSPFGLPLEAGPLQGINLGDPLNITGTGGSLSAYRVNPPNPQPLFISYVVYVHDELGILKIHVSGKKHKNDKYGQAVRGDFDRVVKSLDGKYGANLKHIVNEKVPVGDQSGFAQVFDYLKPSSIWNRDEDFLRALKNGDRLLFKKYSLEGYDPLSDIFVMPMALSFYESYLAISYEATSFKRAVNECPQCVVYKDAKHPYCRKCNKKTNATNERNQKPKDRASVSQRKEPVAHRDKSERTGLGRTEELRRKLGLADRHEDRASASSQRKEPQNAQFDKAKQQRDELGDNIRETKAENKQKTRKYDPVRVDTPPIDPEKLQTSAPPPKPPSATASRPKIRPPGTTGLPNAYERPLKQEVSLDLSADAELPDRFIAALGELIREMKAKGKGQKRYELKEGRRTESAGGDIFYRFPFTDKLEREDQVEMQVDQRQVEGTIVSVGSGHLVLALKKDLGDEVRSAVLLINETGLLDALKEKIEAVNKGKITFNRTLADAVVQPGVLPKRPTRPIRADDGSKLEASQHKAYQAALREAVTFIWGPPGCGKTMTLGAIVHSAFNSGKRTLICSNTNKAVDQVLYKICETLTHEHPAMAEGKVVRLGRIADDKLESKYRKYVAIDEIVERRLIDLKGKKSQLESEIEQSEAEITQIYAEIKDRASASWQRKGSQNAQLDNAKQQRDELGDNIRETRKEIATLRKTVLQDARIVGATCTKAYLTEEIGQFDLVLVDEASMVSRPEVWFSAGLASERVVISGDFRQIPSIVTTEQEAIFQELGLDSFTATERTKPDAPGLAMLTTQFRMHPEICELISGPMYEGELRTSPMRKKVPGRLPPNPFEKPLTIIDTSDLGPIESLDKGSRLNKLHALLVRNFVRHLRLNGVVEANHDLGICTPYSAQARHIQKLLKEDSLDKLVQCGTVHRFQGDERRIVLFEIPESGGRRALGQFVQGVPPDHVGARLISVAVSRAQEHFVVLANLAHLDKKLPSRSLLRSILHKMEHQGRVVQGGELYKLNPIDSAPTDILKKEDSESKYSTSAPSQRKDPDQPSFDQESLQPSASPSKPPSESPSSLKSRSTNPPTGAVMSNSPSPFGLPLEAGPLQGIDLGDPLQVIGGILSQYRITKPPNPHPLFASYFLYVHDELGILRINGIGKINRDDKYGQAVRGDFKRVVKSLDGKYGTNLRHIVNESVSSVDRSGIAQTFDYLKSSSSWKRDDDFLRTLKNGDRVLAKDYYLEGYNPLSKIAVTAMALSSYESSLCVTYDAASFDCIMNEAQSAQDDEAL